MNEKSAALKSKRYESGVPRYTPRERGIWNSQDGRKRFWGTLMIVLTWYWIVPVHIWADEPSGGAGSPSEAPSTFRGHDLGLPLAPQEREELVPERPCGSYAHWDAVQKRCVRDAFPPGGQLPPSSQFLPPPQGVIVLHPGGKREPATTCPEGFQEHVSLGGWRFCIDPAQPEPIPPLMAPPIAGIPFEKAQEILERHQQALRQLPGVKAVGLGVDGIYIQTENPAILPAEVEGLPVKAIPPLGPAKSLSHSWNMRVRPLHGGVAVSNVIGGTLTAVGLSQGQPWLIFPTHLLQNCQMVSPCPPGTTQFLAHCTHYGGTRTIVQPPFTVPELVGFVPRWDPLNGVTDSTDVAAAFMDNDTIEGNGSLCADRNLEVWGNFTGMQGTPMPGTNVTIISSLDPHILSAAVVFINQVVPVGATCNGGLFTRLIVQAIL